MLARAAGGPGPRGGYRLLPAVHRVASLAKMLGTRRMEAVGSYQFQPLQPPTFAAHDPDQSLSPPSGWSPSTQRPGALHIRFISGV